MAKTKNKRPQGEVIISTSETLVKQISKAWLDATTLARGKIGEAMHDAEELTERLRVMFSDEDSKPEKTDPSIDEPLMKRFQ